MVCLWSLLLVKPLMNRNVDNPNLVAYFNHDEGFLMDLVWYYYSGEKRDSFQYESDYGVELLYLADISRLLLSKFFNLTPATFVLLIRWLNLFFWIASLLSLYRLVRYHFGGYWQALLIVILLAVTPVFPYLIGNSKPEAIVLFFMLLGLNYLLRIIDKPSWINLVISIACASAATLIKFTGLFLLLPIAMAMYFARPDKKNQATIFPTLKTAWILPSVIGLILVTLPLLLIFFYVRQTSGITWYKQFGFWNSLLHSLPMLYSLVAGVLLVAFSFVLRMLNQSKSLHFKELNSRIQLLLSYSAIVFLLFVLFSALLGFKWILNPKYFIQSFATTAIEAQVNISSSYGSGFLLANFKHFLNGIKQFGVLIFVLFILYILVEISLKSKSLKEQRLELGFFKRAILAIFILEGIALMYFPIRFARHHMLPFFATSIILIVQTIRIVYLSAYKRVWRKNATLSFIAIALFFNFLQSLKISISSLRYMYRWKEDVVFDIVRWWRANYSADTSIVADHPIYVYLPPEYKNAVFLKFQKDKVKQLRNLVSSFRPQLVYYNTGTDESNIIPPIKEILPNNEVQLLASFNNRSKNYRRHPHSKYLIYKISY